MLDQGDTLKFNENSWVQTLIETTENDVPAMPWQRGERRKEMFARLKNQSE